MYYSNGGAFSRNVCLYQVPGTVLIITTEYLTAMLRELPEKSSGGGYNIRTWYTISMLNFFIFCVVITILNVVVIRH